MSNNIKDRLKIKQVTLDHVDQYDELMRYVFQVTNKDVDECGYEGDELIRSKRPIIEKSKVFGWFTDDEELVSSISIYPFKVNMHGKVYEMGGLTGVGTYPEYVNAGLMNDLIVLALDQMRKDEQYISYLYPYSVSYYRRKGWEIMSDRITFNLKDTQIPQYNQVSGYVKRLGVFDPNVLAVYDAYANAMHGALIRKEFEWEEYWRWENEEERTAAVYFDVNDNPQGYLFYWIEEDVFHVKEIIYNTLDACYGLWNFVRAHFSMIDWVKGNIYMNEPLAFQLEDSQIEETIEPYFMARIVDVEKFLQAYPFDDDVRQFHFVVKDPLTFWNNRVFGLKQVGDRVEITDQPIGQSVELDIQTLTTMMMSYKSPAYLHKVGRLRTDSETLWLLEKIIPTEQPYFSDYF